MHACGGGVCVRYDLEKAASLLAGGGVKTAQPQAPQQQPQPAAAAAAPAASAPAAAPAKPEEKKTESSGSKEAEAKKPTWPEESIKALEAKGLERTTALDVLDMTKGDVQAALDM